MNQAAEATGTQRRVIQNRKGFPWLLMSLTMVVLVLTLWLVPGLPLAAAAGVSIPRGRRGGRNI